MTEVGSGSGAVHRSGKFVWVYKTFAAEFLSFASEKNLAASDPQGTPIPMPRGASVERSRGHGERTKPKQKVLP